MTTVDAMEARRPGRERGPVEHVVRILAKTTMVYLLVGVATGLVYIVGALAWNGDTTVRFWLAAVTPIVAYVAAKMAVGVHRDLRHRQSAQPDLFE